MLVLTLTPNMIHFITMTGQSPPTPQYKLNITHLCLRYFCPWRSRQVTGLCRAFAKAFLADCRTSIQTTSCPHEVHRDALCIAVSRIGHAPWFPFHPGRNQSGDVEHQQACHNKDKAEFCLPGVFHIGPATTLGPQQECFWCLRINGHLQYLLRVFFQNTGCRS